MSFQKTVNADIAWGIPGELALGFPPDVRAEPVNLNVVFNGAPGVATPYGRAMTKTDAPALGYGTTPSHATTAQFGGTGAFLGLLANPKAGVAFTALGGDAPGIEAGAALEVVSETHGLWALIMTNAAVGDGVAFVTDTADGTVAGTLKAAPLQVAPAGTTLIPGARIVRFDVNTGLAIVSLQQMPTPAVVAP